MDRTKLCVLFVVLLPYATTFKADLERRTEDTVSEFASHDLVARLKQLTRILLSLKAMNELQNTVRVTSQQTRTDIIEKPIRTAYKRGYGDSAVLPPWNEFCRLVGMRNCFTSSRS